jgi:nicotinamide N-methyltransferase
VASTLQPPSTVHSFTFSLPQVTNPYGVSASGDPFRGSTFQDGMGGGGPSFLAADPFARPSSAMIGPPVMSTARSMPGSPITDSRPDPSSSAEEGTAYYGVCLTVWSHADAERTAAIRRALEGRARKGSVHSLRAARLNNLRARRRAHRRCRRPAARARASSRTRT